MRLPMQSEIKRDVRSKDHSIFFTIFSALMVMLVIVVMLMAAAIGISSSRHRSSPSCPATSTSRHSRW